MGPLFTPENTARLLRVPFTLAAIRTNCRVWLLEPGEEAELCASAVPCLNTWVAVDPKWASLGLFAFSLGSLALAKGLAYAQWRTAYEAELEAETAKRRRPPEQDAPKSDIPDGVPRATEPAARPSSV